MKAFFQVRARAANSINSYFLLPDGCPMPLFRIGQWVIWQCPYSDSFTHQVVGKICGFEYIDHSKVDSGWSYTLSVETSMLIFPDGTVRKVKGDFEHAPEREIKLLKQQPSKLVQLVR